MIADDPIIGKLASLIQGYIGCKPAAGTVVMPLAYLTIAVLAWYMPSNWMYIVQPSLATYIPLIESVSPSSQIVVKFCNPLTVSVMAGTIPLVRLDKKL